MRRLIGCLLFLTLTIVAVSALAQEPSPQQNASASSQAPLTNKDVVAMQNAGLDPDIILAKIKSSICDFDTSPAALEQLRAAKVSNDVILAMVQAPVANAAPATDSKAANTQNTVQRPGSYLGVFVVPSKRSADGILVKAFTPDSPAAHAGIEEGDILESANGQPIGNIPEYEEKVSLLAPGTQITFKILRRGQESAVTVTTVPVHTNVTFITVKDGQVVHLIPDWAITWLTKNWAKYRDVRFQTSGPANGEANYVVVFSFSSNSLNGFQPVTHTDTSESTSNISGTGTATDNSGNSWDYTMNGQATTTTTTTTTTNEAYTRTYNGVYLTAYNARGEIIARRQHVYSSQTGGDQGTAAGYNLGNALGAIHAKDHLMQDILQDIGLTKQKK